MTRVYVDMVADLFHAGHVAFLRQARRLGDELIVGIHDDAAVAQYKRSPICTMDERITVVEACRYVDEVVPQAPLAVTADWIERHRIDLVAHGDDFDEASLRRFYPEPFRRGLLRTVPYTDGISTSAIISRVLDRSCSSERPAHGA